MKVVVLMMTRQMKDWFLVVVAVVAKTPVKSMEMMASLQPNHMISFVCYHRSG